MQNPGPLNTTAINFLSDLGKRIAAVSGNSREGCFLFQRVSVALQRFNSVCFQGIFLSRYLDTGRLAVPNFVFYLILILSHARERKLPSLFIF